VADLTGWKYTNKNEGGKSVR